jgi:hypothetical protein
MLQKLKSIILLIALFLMNTSTAHAMLIDFEFDLTLNGSSETGSFTLDNFTGIGQEKFDPQGPPATADATGKVTAFQVSHSGIDFTLLDDKDYPDSPVIESFAGVINSILYEAIVTDSSGDNYILEIAFNPGRNSVEFIDPIGNTAEGEITAIRQVSQIPEPATFALLTLGLAGLGFTRSRIKA